MCVFLELMSEKMRYQKVAAVISEDPVTLCLIVHLQFTYISGGL